MATNQPKSIPTRPNHNIRVLVIDDEESVRQLLSQAITKQGWAVETACDGREGLQALLKDDFQVAVVDLMMPGMDGLTFLQEARKIWPWLGVIIHSGNIDGNVIEQAQQLGVEQVLRKPSSIHEIRDAILRDIDNRQQLIGTSGSPLFERILYQLNLLRRLTETTIDANSMLEALRTFATGITQHLPCDIIGVLSIDDGEGVMLMQHHVPLPMATCQALQDHMIRRLHTLTGQEIDRESLRLEIRGEHPRKGAAVPLLSRATVPVIFQGTFHGIIALAARESNAFGNLDISLLYHSAHQLSTLLGSLEHMRHMAIRDPLTGLYNRRHLEEEVQRLDLLAHRHGHPLSLLILDIDHFKDINDTRGHYVGDALLTEFSKVLAAQVRGSDVVARYGGDEFVIILPQTKPDDALRLAERIRERVADHLFLENDKPTHVTASVGVASNLQHERVIPHTQVLEHADQAMYQAKLNGRNQAWLWGQEVSARKAPPQPLEKTGAMEPTHVLIVDDEEAVTMYLAQLLRKHGYQTTRCLNVSEATTILERHPREYQVLLTDLTMPKESGFVLLEKIKDLDPTLIPIVITGKLTAESAVASLRSGAYDLIPKPFVEESLLAAVYRAAEYHRLRTENVQYREHLEDMVRVKNAELQSTLNQLQESYDFTIETMVAMLDSREHETSSHSLRVRDLTRLLAEFAGIKPPELEAIAQGALVHDVGKISIPDTILNKPGPLTPEEWEIMKRHPEIGYQFVQSSHFNRITSEIVLSHHERYNGKGYPKGLKGEEISLGARIFSIIDAYDTMRSSRIYKPSMPPDESLKEIIEQSGKQFDPKIVKVFVRHHADIEDAGAWDLPKEDQ